MKFWYFGAMELRTTGKVIEKLGGYKAIAELTGATVDAVYNWRAQNHFPARTIIAITEALKADGHSAPLSLWRVQKPRLKKPKPIAATAAAE